MQISDSSSLLRIYGNQNKSDQEQNSINQTSKEDMMEKMSEMMEDMSPEMREKMSEMMEMMEELSSQSTQAESSQSKEGMPPPPPMGGKPPPPSGEANPLMSALSTLSEEETDEYVENLEALSTTGKEELKTKLDELKNQPDTANLSSEEINEEFLSILDEVFSNQSNFKSSTGVLFNGYV